MQRPKVVRNTVIFWWFFHNIAKTIGDRSISELAVIEQTIAIVRVNKNVALVATAMTFMKKYKTPKKWSRLKLIYEFHCFIWKHNVWGASTKFRFLAPERGMSRKPHFCNVFEWKWRSVIDDNRVCKLTSDVAIFQDCWYSVGFRSISALLPAAADNHNLTKIIFHSFYGNSMVRPDTDFGKNLSPAKDVWQKCKNVSLDVAGKRFLEIWSPRVMRSIFFFDSRIGFFSDSWFLKQLSSEKLKNFKKSCRATLWKSWFHDVIFGLPVKDVCKTWKIMIFYEILEDRKKWKC